MKYKAINFDKKYSLFNDRWSPKVIAELNDYQFKLVRVKGDFVWHKHDETDEAFLVLEGLLKIEFEDKTIELKEGELYVVPKGLLHRPFALQETKILILEPRGIINTGDLSNELTAENDQWI